MKTLSKYGCNVLLFVMWAPILLIASFIWAWTDSMSEDITLATALLSVLALCLLVFGGIIVSAQEATVWWYVLPVAGYWAPYGLLLAISESRRVQVLSWY